jgi:hypothetical protein
VRSIERFSTGEKTEPQGTLYYLFQRSMVSLCYNYLNIPEKLTNFIAHFEQIAPDSIGMGNFRKSTSGEGDKVNREDVVPVSSLNKFGIYQDYEIFHVELSKEKLVFTSDSVRIVFRMY